MIKKQLENSWLQRIGSEFDLDYMIQLNQFLLSEKSIIYPESQKIFQALNETPFEKVKVVILGQDPYHGPGQAHGLSFSVPDQVAKPPSLLNIFKELQSDLSLPMPKTGNLSPWAQQGVLLLNSVLTVRQSLPGSHQNQGWEKFTDKIITVLNQERQNLVFVLWGAYAQKKGAYIDSNRHFILQSSHPSPLSSYRGFFGSRPFSKINEYLVKTHQAPIDWRLS